MIRLVKEKHLAFLIFGHKEAGIVEIDGPFRMYSNSKIQLSEIKRIMERMGRGSTGPEQILSGGYDPDNWLSAVKTPTLDQRRYRLSFHTSIGKDEADKVCEAIRRSGFYISGLINGRNSNMFCYSVR